MASTNYSCISTSNSWQRVQCQLPGWHQSTGPSLHKGREAPWTEQDQRLVSVGPRWCWLPDCTHNCVCALGRGGEWVTRQYSMKVCSELPLMPWLPGSQPPSKEKELLQSQCRETPGQNLSPTNLNGWCFKCPNERLIGMVFFGNIHPLFFFVISFFFFFLPIIIPSSVSRGPDKIYLLWRSYELRKTTIPDSEGKGKIVLSWRWWESRS